MKSNSLTDKKIAILATNGFEKSELFEPKKAVEASGAEVDVVSIKSGKIKSWDKKDWGKPIEVDVTLKSASAEDYDGLLLPGGVMNPDALRINDDAIEFIKAFVDAGKPIGAICHGSWSLIEARAVSGKTMTSWPSLKTDLENAGATWVDAEAVVDGTLVTSRKPEDIPAFCERFIQLVMGSAPTMAATKKFPLKKPKAKTASLGRH